MALQYSLLFPYDEQGFQIGVRYNGILSTLEKTRKILSYVMTSCQAKFDACACIDVNRLWYILIN
jgi:hypothetical protein